MIAIVRFVKLMNIRPTLYLRNRKYFKNLTDKTTDANYTIVLYLAKLL